MRKYFSGTSDHCFENRGYLRGRGGRGTTLYWQDRGNPDAPEFRGHRFDRSDPDSYRFAPKDQTNNGPLPSHTWNPRFNGQKERDEREAARKRFGHPDEDVMASHNAIWGKVLNDAIVEGRTHTERARIAQAAQQTAGGISKQARAAENEAAAIRRERERAR